MRLALTELYEMSAAALQIEAETTIIITIIVITAIIMAQTEVADITTVAIAMVLVQRPFPDSQ